MSKFFKLYVNENIKVFSKKSTIVFLIVVLLSLLLSFGFTYVIKLSYASYSNNDTWKDIAKHDISYDKENLNSSTSSEDVDSLKARIEVHQYALDNNINLYGNNSYWKAVLTQDLIEKVTILNKLNSGKNLGIDKTEVQKEVDEIYAIINNNDFDKYIDRQIDKYNQMYDNKDITKEQKDIYIETLNLDKKYKINQNVEDDIYGKSKLLTTIQNSKLMLDSGVNNNTNMALSPEEKQKLNEDINIAMYKIENNIQTFSGIDGSSKINYRALYVSIQESIAMSIIGLFIIVIAGGAISTEFGKGTIKSLIMVPCKRWKILLAKIFTYFNILLATTVIMSILTVFFSGIFFKGYETIPYLYMSGSNIQVINFLEYEVLRFLTSAISIVIYMLLAVMLSVVTKNTSASVGISIFIYIGSSIVMEIVNAFITKEWIKFIPFNNMNLTDKIFKYGSSISGNTTSGVNPLITSIPLSFSLCVLAVCAIIMLITVFDSFNKKEIIT